MGPFSRITDHPAQENSKNPPIYLVRVGSKWGLSCVPSTGAWAHELFTLVRAGRGGGLQDSGGKTASGSVRTQSHLSQN